MAHCKLHVAWFNAHWVVRLYPVYSCILGLNELRFFLSQCGSTCNCLSGSVTEIHEYVTGTISNHSAKTAFVTSVERPSVIAEQKKKIQAYLNTFSS